MSAIVAIIGAGPAGCATALTLRRYLPEMEVHLISMRMPTASDTAQVGESVSPGVLPLLDYLGIRQEFFRLGNLVSWGTASAWGTDQIVERDYLFTGRGRGWQIDRSKFDSWLLGVAERAGASLVGARANRATCDRNRWFIDLDDGNTLESDAVVDASGRAAWLARSRGFAPRRDDSLVAEAQWYVHDDSGSGITGALVETTTYGWWYTSMLPDRRSVAMFMTDADLQKHSTWDEKLSLAPATRSRISGWHLTGERAIRTANSQRNAKVAGDGWVSVGDAAIAFDPVSSLGIGFALRSGMEAARVAAAASDNDAVPAASYEASVRRIYAEYQRRLRKIYRAERRWPTAPFWARRQRSEQGTKDDEIGLGGPELQIHNRGSIPN
jgi:flavin-dependent dehydrogenase